MPSKPLPPRTASLLSAPLDSWVAFAADEQSIVGTAATYRALVEITKKAGAADPLIVKTPVAWLPLSV
jgi:hypothetical protein